jgi:2-polyprenyl-6-hydroxyphenyl methylase/3-demethylubiquinone-9 3-methyltransferase
MCEHHGDVLAPIISRLREAKAHRVLDVGCGNGSLTRELSAAGFEVVGTEPDADGAEIARQNGIECLQMSVSDDPVGLGKFDAVVCAEVIEHLFVPSELPRFAARVLDPGAPLIVTTPYHGYVKNLLISVTGRWDDHLEPLHDGGHIKFFSRTTLAELLTEHGFTPTSFEGCGRGPLLWRSMVMTAVRDEPRAIDGGSPEVVPTKRPAD